MSRSGPQQRCGGVFTADPDVPADHRGRRACVCGLLGEPGDPHHTLPDVPEQAEVRGRYDHEELESR
jgi:hypothetical protein